MKKQFMWTYLAIFVAVLILGGLGLTSCMSSSTPAPQYLNAGDANLSITGAQFDQYWLFRFDTSDTAHTMALPSAADIVANLQSPYVGEVINVAVTADGNNSVTLIAGTNVTVKTAVSVVAGNTTVTMYCELDNIKSGSEAVTLY
jgi:flagellar basal body-associated protein FliL